MTPEDLQRCARELEPLEPREGAPAFAREDARAFNASASDVRVALLEPARDLIGRGSLVPELAACLDRTVAELAFWRRVLLHVHRGAFEPGARPSDYLVRYLLS